MDYGQIHSGQHLLKDDGPWAMDKSIAANIC